MARSVSLTPIQGGMLLDLYMCCQSMLYILIKEGMHTPQCTTPKLEQSNTTRMEGLSVIYSTPASTHSLT